MTKLNKKNQKGFTLIELLVVVAIIAILALIVLLALNPVEMSRKSRDSRRLSDLMTVRKAIDLALADKSCTLPTTAAGGVTPTTTTAFVTGCDISKYLSTVPVDPIYAAAGTTQAANGDCTVNAAANKSDFAYRFFSDQTTGTYVLRGKLESVENCNALAQDGNNDNYYEIGTDPGLNLP